MNRRQGSAESDLSAPNGGSSAIGCVFRGIVGTFVDFPEFLPTMPERRPGFPLVKRKHFGHSSEQSIVNAAVVLNLMHRLANPLPPAPLCTPEALRLREEPRADCARYDQLRGNAHVH